MKFGFEPGFGNVGLVAGRGPTEGTEEQQRTFSVFLTYLWNKRE